MQAEGSKIAPNSCVNGKTVQVAGKSKNQFQIHIEISKSNYNKNNTRTVRVEVEFEWCVLFILKASSLC